MPENEYYWQDNHITQKDGWFLAWDETGADTIGEFSTIEEARDALSKYSLSLSGQEEGNSEDLG